MNYIQKLEKLVIALTIEKIDLQEEIQGWRMHTAALKAEKQGLLDRNIALEKENALLSIKPERTEDIGNS